MTNLPHITEFSRAFTGEYSCIHLSSHQIWAILIFWKTDLIRFLFVFWRMKKLQNWAKKHPSDASGEVKKVYWRLLLRLFEWIQPKKVLMTSKRLQQPPKSFDATCLQQIPTKLSFLKIGLRQVFQNIKMAQIWCEDRWRHQYSPVKTRENSVMWGKFAMPG